MKSKFFPLNRNGKKLTVSYKSSKVLTIRRKGH